MVDAFDAANVYAAARKIRTTLHEAFHGVAPVASFAQQTASF
jgi:hypothetical protein